MGAVFKAGSFHVQPVFTTQQHTQPDALWCQHLLLPLQEAAFDSWKAESKKGRNVQRKPLAFRLSECSTMLPVNLEHFM